ncbi:gluconate:proton symporter [Weissella paramesenteroides]|uniref:gluconate:proton symporter n=1 Tax=Weissella paramesenteroides TaxID=1249 RepID=UPI00123C2B38|nr:gluconate:proton symporter [Weissella paramesenteroides]KAA8456470.1 gluconate:proton symporter [Weissella paramesenteroides]KAA8456586.1 gluconate:proton symporter [Weissella paramesenteroides]KAA8459092.1 gluconate:proton symporter [Weissella paramesenteroides]KAA8463498.1 gluconate:proton symporter [Weissella paramesenteroides]KAA8465549.1 gluconate:proton symporter [Weissella paramesenteroides]
MNTLLVILMLLSFVIFVYYILHNGNMTIGFLVMAAVWTIIGFAGGQLNHAVITNATTGKVVNVTGLTAIITNLKTIFNDKIVAYGGTIVAIVFGSWFGRTLVESGIAASISNAVAKFGEKKKMLTATLVVAVTALIFLSAYGVGSVVAVGVILLPVLLNIGIPRPIALTAFTVSVGAPLYLNTVQFNQFKAFFPQANFADPKYIKFGFIAMVIQLIFVILFLFINKRKYTDQQIAENREFLTTKEIDALETPNVSKIAWFIPLVPVALSMIFKMESVAALLIAIILAALVTGQAKSWKKFVDFLDGTAQRGVKDISGLITFLLILMTFQGVAGVNADLFTPIFRNIIPQHNLLLLVVGLGILAPLALMRGPLMAYGAGAATVAVLSSLNILPDSVLLPLISVASIFAISTDITQSWNVWGMDYLDVKSGQFLKHGVPLMWGVTFINQFVVWIVFH